MADAQRIVIVGGGFGGLRAAQRLARLGDAVEITLIDRVNHHVFQPLLYQVATGILSPGQIAPALRSLFRRRPNVRVVLGEVTGFDLAARTVTATVPEDFELPYDSLVVAAGSTGSYFGHDEWAPDAPGLKSLDDAQRIRTRVLAAYELAEIAPDDASRLPWLTFVVVGAGPTGVELCGQFEFLSRKTLAGQFRTFDSRQARVILLDAGPAVLPSFPEKLRRAAARELERQGVEIRLSAKATSIDETGITVSGPDGDERIATHTVVWAAGVTASPLARPLGDQSGAALDRSGRLTVGPDLSLPGHPEVFAIGDMVHVDNVPGVAQGALQEGAYVADVLTRRIRGQIGRAHV